MLPDGNGEFTRKMGMLVERTSNGMGLRSWRYAMYVKDRTIEAFFMEPGFKDNPPGVPLDVPSAENMLRHLQSL
jgi:peroxiredoxin